MEIKKPFYFFNVEYMKQTNYTQRDIILWEKDMNHIKYTKDQREELWQNKYVKNCSEKYITFTDECKIEAMTLKESWIYSRDIFKALGFPDFILHSQVPIQSLKNWSMRLKARGILWFKETKKWRKMKEKQDLSNMSKDDYIAYLETQVASMKEIQNFLRKRGKYP